VIKILPQTSPQVNLLTINNAVQNPPVYSFLLDRFQPIDQTGLDQQVEQV